MNQECQNPPAPEIPRSPNGGLSAELHALMTKAAAGLSEFRTDDEQQVTSGRPCDYRAHALRLAADLNRLLTLLVHVARGEQ